MWSSTSKPEATEDKKKRWARESTAWGLGKNKSPNNTNSSSSARLAPLGLSQSSSSGFPPTWVSQSLIPASIRNSTGTALIEAQTVFEDISLEKVTQELEDPTTGPLKGDSPVIFGEKMNNCFYGKSLLQWLIKHQYAFNEESALQMANTLVKQHYITDFFGSSRFTPSKYYITQVTRSPKSILWPTSELKSSAEDILSTSSLKNTLRARIGTRATISKKDRLLRSANTPDQSRRKIVELCSKNEAPVSPRTRVASSVELNPFQGASK